MHRNHIKECSGHFVEEWHQKLHNNTTPDDVVICSAYVAFMKNNGDVATFYRSLQEGGVTRERLKSFERPIKSEPTFFADRKDALIKDFEAFGRTLKSVHSGTDLDSAAAAARGRLDEGQKKRLDALFALETQVAGGRGPGGRRDLGDARLWRPRLARPRTMRRFGTCSFSTWPWKNFCAELSNAKTWAASRAP